MRVTVVTPPLPLVTLREAGVQVGLGDDIVQDDCLAGVIAAASGHIDGPSGWLGRAIGKQVLLAEYDDFLCIGQLPYPVLIGIDHITYVAPDRTVRTIDPALYDEFDGRILPAEGARWPDIYQGQHAGSFARVKIQFRAGYEVVPAPIKAAVLLMVGDLYKFRETASDATTTPSAVPMSTTVDALLDPYRIYC